MRGLIGDLLDAGHIEAGTLSVAPEPTEVVALVYRARSPFLPADGWHTVPIDSLPDLPQVMAVRRHMVQVLNLLSHAARQSPHSAPIGQRERLVLPGRLLIGAVVGQGCRETANGLQRSWNKGRPEDSAAPLFGAGHAPLASLRTGR